MDSRYTSKNLLNLDLLKVSLVITRFYSISDKKCLSHDETPLNEFIEKSKFYNEGLEEMYSYSISAKVAIHFDLKKFYHNYYF